jgi:hypothetical protein
MDDLVSLFWADHSRVTSTTFTLVIGHGASELLQRRLLLI